jgi:hypothetical protein
MINKNTPNRAKKLDLHGARQLIFILAASSTLGFWAIVSKVDHTQALQASETPQAAGATPPQQTGNQIVLDLPPLPTLMPTLDPSATGQDVVSVPLQNPVTVSKPSVPSSGKILMGGAKPSRSSNAPVTSTGSSK